MQLHRFTHIATSTFNSAVKNENSCYKLHMLLVHKQLQWSAKYTKKVVSSWQEVWYMKCYESLIVVYNN